MPGDAAIRAVTLPRRDTLISVCGACSADTKAVRATLKSEYKRRGRGKSVRVVKSSCLDICPKRGVAIAVASALGGQAGVRYFILTRDGDMRLAAEQLGADAINRQTPAAEATQKTRRV